MTRSRESAPLISYGERGAPLAGIGGCEHYGKQMSMLRVDVVKVLDGGAPLGEVRQLFKSLLEHPAVYVPEDAAEELPEQRIEKLVPCVDFTAFFGDSFRPLVTELTDDGLSSI